MTCISFIITIEAVTNVALLFVSGLLRIGPLIFLHSVDNASLTAIMSNHTQSLLLYMEATAVSHKFHSVFCDFEVVVTIATVLIATVLCCLRCFRLNSNLRSASIKCNHDQSSEQDCNRTELEQRLQQKQLSSIIVEVQLPIGKPLFLKAWLTDTVQCIKQQVEDCCGWRSSATRLLFRGKQLSNMQTLVEAEIDNWSTLYLHVHLSGGMRRQNRATHPLQCTEYRPPIYQLYQENTVTALKF